MRVSAERPMDMGRKDFYMLRINESRENMKLILGGKAVTAKTSFIYGYSREELMKISYLQKLTELTVERYRSLMANISKIEEIGGLVKEINSLARTICDQCEELDLMKSDRIRHSHKEELKAVLRFHNFINDTVNGYKEAKIEAAAFELTA